GGASTTMFPTRTESRDARPRTRARLSTRAEADAASFHIRSRRTRFWAAAGPAQQTARAGIRTPRRLDIDQHPPSRENREGSGPDEDCVEHRRNNVDVG